MICDDYESKRKFFHLSQKSGFLLSWNGYGCVENNFTGNDLIQKEKKNDIQQWANPLCACQMHRIQNENEQKRTLNSVAESKNCMFWWKNHSRVSRAFARTPLASNWERNCFLLFFTHNVNGGARSTSESALRLPIHKVCCCRFFSRLIAVVSVRARSWDRVVVAIVTDCVRLPAVRQNTTVVPQSICFLTYGSGRKRRRAYTRRRLITCFYFGQNRWFFFRSPNFVTNIFWSKNWIQNLKISSIEWDSE